MAEDKQTESLQRQVAHYRARLREVVDEYEAKLLNLKLQAEDVINELSERLDDGAETPVLDDPDDSEDE